MKHVKKLMMIAVPGEERPIPRIAAIYYLKCPEKIKNMLKTRKYNLYTRKKSGNRNYLRETRSHI